MGYPPIQKIKEYRAQHGCSLREAVAALNSNREIAVDHRDAELSRLRAEVERLREALEPFEELSCEGNWDQPDDTKVIVHAGRATCYWLTLADLRRARKALEGGE